MPRGQTVPKLERNSMLCLSRKLKEVLWIGECRVVLTRAVGNVRLAIAAPRSTPVHREEVLKEIGAADPDELARLGYRLTDNGTIEAVAPLIRAA